MTENTENLESKRRKPQKKIPAGKLVRRILISVGLTIVMLLLLAWTLIFTIAHGPSESMKKLLVGMAMQASATKAVPYLVLPASEVEEIMAEAASGNEAVYSPTDISGRFVKKIITDENGQRIEITVLEGGDGTAVITNAEGSTEIVEYNEWDYAIDGIQYITIPRANFKAYMLIIKDPSRVYVATSSDYKGNEAGKRFYEIAERENCVALINGGEFADIGGQGDGGKAEGLTYSRGECLVQNDSFSWKTFIGFTNDNKLYVADNLKRADADAIGMRDGVCFRPASYSSSSRLIYTDKEGQIHVSTFNSSSPAQRTAIGQRADGAVIFIVTDGRSATSIGASYNDMTQLMYEYGAVTAGMLDGGSSAMLYYRDYFKLYNIDESTLDKYQKMGLVNKYVAATEPRRIPSYFCVAPSGGTQ